ncbi:hypothetical protein [Citrobacter sp. RHBSTW-00671]|uniref:hypothetical protein n=1 Tax=Citrobacter sp. RHBSTW-00671 TaxID=2742660 RepID=UPI0017A0A38D|nr:hypothetical protein [Citrobacter sp. RHBSTW-00671]MBA7967453.1 hypothetical protein [Citrobacter sp. RHBSTW-00671]HCJ6372720.1 hypothetical protein [Citrobacter freundii]
MKRLAILLLAAQSLPAMAGSTDWPDAFRGIAAGEAQWLEQVPALAAVADVKQAQRLEDSLAAALTANTAGALRALDVIDAGHWPHMIGSDIVCTPPTETPDKVDAFYQRTRQVLLSTAAGAKCLWILEASYDELKADNTRKVK